MKKIKLVLLVCAIFSAILLAGCRQACVSNKGNPVVHSALDGSDNKKQDDGGYYLITEENGLFSYTIYDEKMNAVRAEDNLTKRPEISMVSDCVISVTEQAGTGIATSFTYYYDVENNRFSNTYQGVFDQRDDLVIYATYDKVIIRDIFIDDGYYQEISTFCAPFSPAAFPFINAEFVDDTSSVRITYFSGTEYEEVSELFELVRMG